MSNVLEASDRQGDPLVLLILPLISLLIGFLKILTYCMGILRPKLENFPLRFLRSRRGITKDYSLVRMSFLLEVYPAIL